jgi:hypothetical protein
MYIFHIRRGCCGRMVVDLQLPLPIISKVVICGHDRMVVDLQLPIVQYYCVYFPHKVNNMYIFHIRSHVKPGFLGKKRNTHTNFLVSY